MLYALMINSQLSAQAQGKLRKEGRRYWPAEATGTQKANQHTFLK